MAQTTTSMTPADTKKLLAALEANWQAEMEGYYTYAAFAKNETDPQRRNTLRGLAAAEKHHADLWASRIQALGAPAPQYTGDPSGQADTLANRAGGVDLALRRLEIDEGRDIAKYGKQLKSLGDPPSIAILNEVIADEREHYQTLSNLIRSRRPLPAMPPEHAQAVPRRSPRRPRQGSCQSSRLGWRRNLRRQRRPRLHLRHRLRRLRRDARQQPLRPHRRPRRHGRQRPIHGLRSLPRRKERTRDLRSRVCPRAGSRRRQRSPKRAKFSPSAIKSAACPKKTPTASSIRSQRTRKNSSRPSHASASTRPKKA